jgi:hypothetical protein
MSKLKNTLTDIALEADGHPNGDKAWATVSPDGGELSTGAMPVELGTDWDSVLKGFGLDPDVFEVVDDTVRMSKWQSSKRLENGDRDLIWLYSYRARFRRKSLTALPDTEVEDIRKYVQKWKPLSKTKQESPETGSTLVVCWADQQLGKSAGGGVDATVERILDSYTATIERVKELRRNGRNIEKIAIVNMGDQLKDATATTPASYLP